MAEREWPEYLVAQYNHHCADHNADYDACPDTACPDTACTAAFAEELALFAYLSGQSVCW